mmetsp:Transcript_11590/g.10103  ORF Transcript_11590/g.10103 Transcript_11590/m.10103 type:complete len:186 (+) Transcript_11590:2809-3366(+)
MSGQDNYGAHKAVSLYFNKISEVAKKDPRVKNLKEYETIMKEIEHFMCKRLYAKIFPDTETKRDTGLWKACKAQEWATYDHLEIPSRNRSEEMWEYAAEVLNSIDNKITPFEKLECIVECNNIIKQVCTMSSNKDEGPGAGEILPILIYIILKAQPRKLHSNITFIQILRDFAFKKHSNEEYCLT